MKITTAKEFMRVIANHYEKCKAIYWDAMHGIGVFDRRIVKLKGLPEDPVERQGVAIMYAVLAAPILESGEAELEVDKDVLQEVHERFAALMAIEKFIARGYLAVRLHLLPETHLHLFYLCPIPDTHGQ